MHRRARLLWSAAGVSALCAIAPAAAARQPEPQPDLVAQLRRTIALLEEQLRAVQQERDALRARLEALQGVAPSQPPAETPAPTAPAGPATPRAEPPDPYASPDALLAALKDRYAADLPPPPTDDPEQADAFHQRVARWCRDISRSMRQRREWIVRIDELLDAPGRGSVAWVRLVDPRTADPQGEAIPIRLSQRFASRIQRQPETDLWTVRLLVVAQPRYAPGRPDRGIFDAPPFVGPFVEFGWEAYPYAVFPYRPPRQDPRPAQPPPGP